jgi:DNA-binding MarR family transcriptional regulator
MSPDKPDIDVPIPALLRAARGAYARSIRERLQAIGIYDLPRNGPYIVGGLSRSVHAGQLLREIGLRDGAATRLIENLLEHGFVQPGKGSTTFGVADLELTPKGHAAAEATEDGIVDVNEELATMLSSEELSALEKGLIALTTIRERLEDHRDHDHDHGHEHDHDHQKGSAD